MLRVTLACAAGMSTSLLVSKMKKAIEEKEVAMTLMSVSEKEFEKYLGETDILLLGPQVSFLEKKYQALFRGTDKKVLSIPILEYGRMDGAKVVDRVLSLANMEEHYE